MRVAVIHNYYRNAGGEDRVFAAEQDLLALYGHDVLQFSLQNSEIVDGRPLRLAARTVWNGEVYKELRGLFSAFQPKIVHVHNTLPLISPAVYYAAKAEGAAVVQTLHNFRLICPSAVLYRNGRPCEDCIGRSIPLPGVLHRCYRRSLGASAVVATTLAYHRLRGTYDRMVDRYIALSEFAKSKFVEGGLPSDAIAVKPNFLVNDPGPGDGSGQYALFVGRLAEGKGIRLLMEAWRRVGASLPLRIVGSGPLAGYVAHRAAEMDGVRYLGRLPSDSVVKEMGAAAMLVLPSLYYEGFPMAIVEAFAVGTPVLCSNRGSMAEIVTSGVNGEHFTAGDADDLTRAVEALASDEGRRTRLRRSTRLTFEAKYMASVNYSKLMDIYREAAGDKMV